MFSFLIFLFYSSVALAATPAQWRGRSIYQVLTDRYARSDGSTTATCDTTLSKYCGGSWQGIINKLDYIQQMGFTAIWISPITHNILNDGAFHGYWQDDIYSLNPAFGTENDLKNLSTALHDRGMYLMVDVVANHFAWAGTVASVDYSTFIPFNDSKYFHSPCGLSGDDTNQTNLEDCWLGYNTAVELPDVDTTRQDVKDAYYAWIKGLATKYSIDGFRVDTVKHVQKDFWPTFNQDAGVYCVGEVFSGNPGYVCDYQNYMDGLLNYPLFYPLTRAFQSTSGSIPDLVNMVNTLKSGCKDSTLLGTFLENHDNPRFPSLTSDMALDQNAIAFTILGDGIPIIYQGQEQHYSGGNDPNNREAIWLSGYNTSAPLYRFIAIVNQIRNQAIYKDSNYLNYKAYPIYSDTTTIAMRKGFDGAQVIAIFSNKGSFGDSYSQSIPSTGFAVGSDIVEVLGCTRSTIDSSGNLNVAMGQGAPKIFYPAAKLVGSGICGL